MTSLSASNVMLLGANGARDSRVARELAITVRDAAAALVPALAPVDTKDLNLVVIENEGYITALLKDAKNKVVVGIDIAVTPDDESDASNGAAEVTATFFTVAPDGTITATVAPDGTATDAVEDKDAPTAATGATHATTADAPIVAAPPVTAHGTVLRVYVSNTTNAQPLPGSALAIAVDEAAVLGVTPLQLEPGYAFDGTLASVDGFSLVHIANVGGVGYQVVSDATVLTGETAWTPEPCYARLFSQQVFAATDADGVIVTAAAHVVMSASPEEGEVNLYVLDASRKEVYLAALVRKAGAKIMSLLLTLTAEGGAAPTPAVKGLIVVPPPAPTVYVAEGVPVVAPEYADGITLSYSFADLRSALRGIFSIIKDKHAEAAATATATPAVTAPQVAAASYAAASGSGTCMLGASQTEAAPTDAADEDDDMEDDDMPPLVAADEHDPPSALAIAARVAGDEHKYKLLAIMAQLGQAPTDNFEFSLKPETLFACVAFMRMWWCEPRPEDATNPVHAAAVRMELATLYETGAMQASHVERSFTVASLQRTRVEAAIMKIGAARGIVAVKDGGCGVPQLSSAQVAIYAARKLLNASLASSRALLSSEPAKAEAAPTDAADATAVDDYDDLPPLVPARQSGLALLSSEPAKAEAAPTDAAVATAVDDYDDLPPLIRTAPPRQSGHVEATG